MKYRQFCYDYDIWLDSFFDRHLCKILAGIVIAFFVVSCVLTGIVVRWAVTSSLAVQMTLIEVDVKQIKTQQEANQRTIEYLTDQTFYLRELVQRAAKNQIP